MKKKSTEQHREGDSFPRRDDPDVVVLGTATPYARVTRRVKRHAEECVSRLGEKEEITASQLFVGAGKPTGELRQGSGFPSFTRQLDEADPFGTRVETPEMRPVKDEPWEDFDVGMTETGK